MDAVVHGSVDRQAATSEDVAALADLVARSERVVAFTGAGISVPSGIPDFRTPGSGLWADVDPMEVAHIDAWRRDPDRFWRFYGDRFASLVDKRPNPAHLALAELERDGAIEAVITQNVDRLHRLAGSERLIELHGSIEWSICPQCGGRTAIDDVVSLLGAEEGAPECPACIYPLKPCVVLFGEMLPQEAVEEAERLAGEADLMLCVGSSLTVHPAAGLPELTLRSGGQIAIVTESATPLDPEAALKVERDAAAVLGELLAALRTR